MPEGTSCTGRFYRRGMYQRVCSLARASLHFIGLFKCLPASLHVFCPFGCFFLCLSFSLLLWFCSPFSLEHEICKCVPAVLCDVLFRASGTMRASLAPSFMLRAIHRCFSEQGCRIRGTARILTCNFSGDI